MKHRVEYLQSVIDDDLPQLSVSAKSRIRRAIEQKLMTHPIEFGKPLRYSLKGARRLRVGDYRIIFIIETDAVVVIKIGHRREVYLD